MSTAKIGVSLKFSSNPYDFSDETASMHGVDFAVVIPDGGKFKFTEEWHYGESYAYMRFTVSGEDAIGATRIDVGMADGRKTYGDCRGDLGLKSWCYTFADAPRKYPYSSTAWKYVPLAPGPYYLIVAYADHTRKRFDFSVYTD